MLTGLFMGDPANNIWNLLDSSLISSTPLTHTLHTRRPAGRTDKPDKTSDRPVRKFQNNDRALEPNGYTRKSSGRSIRTHQSLQGAESHLHETSQTAVTPLFTGALSLPPSFCTSPTSTSLPITTSHVESKQPIFPPDNLSLILITSRVLA